MKKMLLNKPKVDKMYYLMILPAFILLIGIFYPFIIGVLTSFTNKKLYSGKTSFIGISNYVSNFQNPVFIQSLVNTFLYTILTIAIQLPLGFGVALLLDSINKGKKLLTSILVFPLLIPPIVSSLMWKTMMHPNAGVLNFLLSKMGIKPFLWLTGLNTALFSLVILDTWVFLPFTTILIISGLQSIPIDIVEAAHIDGANFFKIVRYIKLPWCYPYLLLALLFRVSDSLKAFEIIYSTTRGGPLNATRTLNIMAYEETFRWSNLGNSLSMVFLLWFFSYVISTFLVKKWQKENIGGGM